MHLRISAHNIGGFDRKKFSEHLNLLRSMECISIIAIGYEGSMELLPYELKNIENAIKRI